MLLHFTKKSFQGILTVTQILLEPSCVTWDISFNCRHGYTSLCATPCISVKLHYYYLSYKLRCLRRIYIPEKIRNNTREKMRFFSRAFDIFNQRWYVTRLSLHSSFAPLGQVDEWTAKSSPFSIQCHLLEFLGLWRLKQFKIPYRLRTVTFKTFLDREKNENKKIKTESYVFSGCGNDISLRWDRKSTLRRFATGRFWPCTWKISAVGKDHVKAEILQVENYAHCSFL